MKGRARIVLAALAVAGLAAAAVLWASIVDSERTRQLDRPRRTTGSCTFANGIKHVIQIQFDNTHFLRDNRNVPSDLEQMPHLLNFIRGNGTLLTNDHTVLISHTRPGSSDADRRLPRPHGPARLEQLPATSRRAARAAPASSFAYWTAPLFDPAGPPFPPAGQTDLTPEMINENGQDRSGSVGSVHAGGL